jgi:hypothetical protein
LGLALIALDILLRPWGPSLALSPLALAVLLPPLLLLSVAAAGFTRALRRPAWTPVLGLTVAPVASLVVAFASQNRVLISYRHFEYLSLPAALFAAETALAVLSRRTAAPAARRLPRLAVNRAGRAAAGLVLLALFATNVWAGQSVMAGRLGPDERIPDTSLRLVTWMTRELGPGASIAADHRISQVLWARGFLPTNDEAVAVFTEAEWYRVVDELRRFEPRVDYVFVDHVMVESGVQSGSLAEPPRISDGAYGKFSLQPYRLVARMESADGLRWAELYRIDWGWAERHSWLERYLP